MSDDFRLLRPQLILSLCDHTGNWSRPYEQDDYDVIRVDLQDGRDVRLFELPDRPVHGILAAPPCTVFANSGSRWPRTDDELREGLSIVDACLRIILMTRPHWWALENPTGKLPRWLGPASYTFQPNQHGDPYTKRTCLWGSFNPPTRTPVPATMGSAMHRIPDGPQRVALRSLTPEGFARAFFEANP